MLRVDGDADAAVENRIRIGSNKFRQLLPLPTNKDISLKVRERERERERLYSGCVRSSMLHGSETWPIRKENDVALQQAEMRMVRWMCGVKLQHRIPSKGLRERLGLDDIILVLQQNRLRWYGHVSKTTWVSRYQKKHSTTHTHSDHQPSPIHFLNPPQSTAPPWNNLRKKLS